MFYTSCTPNLLKGNAGSNLWCWKPQLLGKKKPKKNLPGFEGWSRAHKFVWRFLQLLLRSCKPKQSDWEQLNHHRGVLLKESAVCGLKHLTVFRVNIVLLLKFPGMSNKKLTILWKNGDTFAICFLLVPKKCLNSRNADQEQGVFKSIQAVADVGFEVHFTISVFRILPRSQAAELLVLPSKMLFYFPCCFILHPFLTSMSKIKFSCGCQCFF